MVSHPWSQEPMTLIVGITLASGCWMHFFNLSPLVAPLTSAHGTGIPKQHRKSPTNGVVYVEERVWGPTGLKAPADPPYRCRRSASPKRVRCQRTYDSETGPYESSRMPSILTIQEDEKKCHPSKQPLSKGSLTPLALFYTSGLSPCSHKIYTC